MQWAEKKVRILISHFAVGFVTCPCGERFVPCFNTEGKKLNEITHNAFLDGTAKKNGCWGCKKCNPI